MSWQAYAAALPEDCQPESEYSRQVFLAHYSDDLLENTGGQEGRDGVADLLLLLADRATENVPIWK